MNPFLRAALPALISLNCLAAGVDARLDRQQIQLGDSVELSLEVEGNTPLLKPDLSPLAADFELLGTRQVSSLSTYNGSARTSTRLILSLQPRRSGTLAIPSIRIGDAESPALTLRVEEAPAGASAQVAPVFIDASLSADEVYVQQQTVLTLRIYHSVSLYNYSTPPLLEMPGAKVEELGEPKTFEQELNGVRHGVIELRYAIYPQKSGELSIPSQPFSATLAQRGNAYQPLMAARMESPSIPLRVKPRPAEFPADAAWLPARSLSLTEAWSPQPDKAMEGISLTRNLLLRADGLSGSQLPPLEQAEIGGLRLYPEAPQSRNQADERGLLGSREESVALVPTRAGEFVLPGIEVPWWNTELDRLEIARLPERRLKVAINPQLQAEALPLAEGSVQAPRLWPWQLATGVLGLTTLLGFGLWWHARRQPAIAAASATGPSPRTLLDDLKRACLAGDPQATRQALDAWARQQPETLADMAGRFEALSLALDELNGALYSESGQNWQGEGLWKAVKALPALSQEAVPNESALPPLYPR